MGSIREYVIESFDELKNKVTWPTWVNLTQTTGVVLLASLVLAVLIFGMDAVTNFALKTFIYRVK